METVCYLNTMMNVTIGRIFCRSTLCTSAAYATVQCLSVRPSVMFVYSVETNKHIFKIFHHQVAKVF